MDKFLVLLRFEVVGPNVFGCGVQRERVRSIFYEMGTVFRVLLISGDSFVLFGGCQRDFLRSANIKGG